MIRTPETARFLDDPDGPVRAVPVATAARRAGEAAEVAQLAVFLCSDDAAYINGANVAIGGGKAARNRARSPSGRPGVTVSKPTSIAGSVGSTHGSIQLVACAWLVAGRGRITTDTALSSSAARTAQR
jgi:hypothetical protein